jgi:transcriptional regulator with XRE-family HTH domain
MDAELRRYCARLGRHIRDLRDLNGLTQEDMIDRGFSLRHYQRIEAGRSITLVTMLKLAKAFGVEPRDVLPLETPRAKRAR